MSDVIVERPRRGMRNATRHAPWEKNANVDDLPAREGVRKRHTAAGTRRELNENLAPLRRFLMGQAGRPWNVVYSEICANIRPQSAVQLHVLQHVWDFVERGVVMADDGAVCSGPGRRYVAMHPLRVGALYIHPVSGLLQRVRRRRGMPRREAGTCVAHGAVLRCAHGRPLTDHL